MELPQTLIDAVHYFSDRERCEELLRDIRWPDGVVKCPHCKSTHVRYMISVNRWKCYTKHKRPQFSVRTGTIFEESAVPFHRPPGAPGHHLRTQRRKLSATHRHRQQTLPPARRGCRGRHRRPNRTTPSTPLRNGCTVNIDLTNAQRQRRYRERCNAQQPRLHYRSCVAWLFISVPPGSGSSHCREYWRGAAATAGWPTAARVRSCPDRWPGCS